MKRLFLALVLLLSPATAWALPVDLELVLAIDVSRSVDAEEAKLQREGYMAALTHSRVLQAIRSGPNRRIAVIYIEWAASSMQRIVVPWTVIEDETSAQNFIARIEATPYVSWPWTSISGAIDFAVPLFEDNGYEGTRRVIDISGDGRNNSGRLAEMARDEAVARGIVINGLPILNDRPNFSRPPEYDLELYYRESVIVGPGSFVVAADDFSVFAGAILSKLIREIAGDYGDQYAER
jgi:hypothetical protein